MEEPSPTTIPFNSNEATLTTVSNVPSLVTPASLSKNARALTIHDIISEQPHLLISIQRTQYQPRSRTIKSCRFLLRVTEAFIGVTAIAFLYRATFHVNYTSSSIGVSGINIVSLTAVTSFVDILNATQIVILLFPSVAGIQPIHEQSVSLVECVFDLFYMLLWLITSSILATRGKCPQYLYLDPSSPEHRNIMMMYMDRSAVENPFTSIFDRRCMPWNMVWLLGYAIAILFMCSAILGLRNWRKQRTSAKGA